MSLDVDTELLYSTTDAQVWAREWRRAASHVREFDHLTAADLDESESWLLTWFANAMETAKTHERRRIAEQLVGYPITVDLDRLGAGA